MKLLPMSFVTVISMLAVSVTDAEITVSMGGSKIAQQSRK